MITFERLQSILECCSKLNIGLVGDLFLDRYLEIAPGVEEYSIETGLEAYQVGQVRNQPGALGTVMNNLAALGVGRMTPLTVIGDDGHGYDLLRTLESLPMVTESIIQRTERLTPTYTKPIRAAERGEAEELNRLDIRSREPLHREATQAVIDNLDRLFQATDGVIVLDQINETDWGVVNAEVRDALADRSRKFPEKVLFVDSRSSLSKFRFGILKGNESEFLATCASEGNLSEALHQICQSTGRPAYCTRGAAGMLVATGNHEVKHEVNHEVNHEVTHVPGYHVDGPVDIVGAGDSATAGIVVALLAGADPIEAAALANLVASITVQQLGTTGVATPAEVLLRHRQSNRTLNAQ